jgi:hypothetical protein
MNKKHLYSPNDDIPISVKPSVAEPAPAPAADIKTFTLSKQVKDIFSIDKTPLVPNPATLLSVGQFEHAYLKQLESLIYNDMECLDSGTLMTITSLSDIVKATHRPIRLMSQAYRKKLPTLCKVLNQFYAENHKVIRGIADQLAN